MNLRKRKRRKRRRRRRRTGRRKIIKSTERTGSREKDKDSRQMRRSLRVSVLRQLSR